ncbi:transcriptional regulator [Streptomyces sp. NPDC005407]|uniref:transcriptional regulator n=1 Tax=Streptomyces sp. NPDC005407 TaxID=3155340 RepID=UPI0033B403B7
MDAQQALTVLGAVASAVGGYYAWRALDGPAIAASQARFCEQRTDISARFGELCEISADMHIAARPSLARIGATALLWEDAMRPPAPVRLDRLRLAWDPALPPQNPKLLKAARHVLPKVAKRARYGRYSLAMGDLARPSLFEDRFSFRLVSADWNAPQGPSLVFGSGQYFDLVDQNEAVAHELAVETRTSPRPPSWRRMPMRSVLKRDPLSLKKRVVLPAIATLTVRRTPDGQGTFFLLHRGVGQVATGGGVYGPIPAGMHQPASLSPLGYRRDLDIWHTIMREYNEELLGAPEATGAGGQEVDYTAPPYGALDRALTEGSLRVWCFGMALEPLNLAVCVLTVAVFESAVFDTIFAEAVPWNEEGTLISGPRQEAAITGLPLSEEAIRDLPSPRIAPPAAGLLHLALEHRDLLLGAAGT